MQTTSFDKINLKFIREDMTKALEEVGKKYGVSFNLKGISFTSTNFRVGVECHTEMTESGEKALKPEERQFDKSAKLYGVMIERNVSILHDNLGEVQFVGMNIKSHKYPFIVLKKDNGKRYKMGADQAKWISEKYLTAKTGS